MSKILIFFNLLLDLCVIGVRIEHLPLGQKLYLIVRV